MTTEECNDVFPITPTAAEFIQEYIRDISRIDYTPELVIDVENALKALIEFAKEAIKADRVNLLEHVKINWPVQDSIPERSKSKKLLSINKDSIINAPNIELL